MFLFPAKELNAVLRSGYIDNFGFYQQQFGPYATMQLTKAHKYVIKDIKGRPLMLKPYNSCVMENGCLITETKREIQPDRAYVKCIQCDDEFLDSAYEHVLQYSAEDGQIEMDSAGAGILQNWFDELIETYTMDVMASLSVGKFHTINPGTVDYDDDATLEERDLFADARQATEGWLTQLQAKYTSDTTKYLHLDYPETVSNLTAYDNTKWTAGTGYSDPVTPIIDEMIKKAPKKLQTIINEGVGGFGTRSHVPYIPVSNLWFNSLVDEANDIADAVATNDRALAWRTFGDHQVLYYRNRIPIIPISHIGVYDEYLKGTTNYLGVTVSKNIQLGGSFNTASGEIGGVVPGIAFQKSTNFQDTAPGAWTMLSKSLLKSAVSDTDLITGMISYTQ